MKMVVKGIGVAGGFGCGVQDLAAALQGGVGQISEFTIPTPEGPLQLPAFRAQTARLEEFVAKRTLRRIDHYSKLGLLGAYLSLQDGGLLGSDLGRMGVIIASGYGATATTFAFLDSIISDGDICASPTHFANSVHNSAAANISIMLGAKGPSLTVSQFEMSVPSALTTAREWLREGRVDAVAVGAIDELSDLIGYLWHRRNGERVARPVSPLDFDRDTSILGEGAAFLLLTRDDGGEGYCTIDSVEVGSVYEGSVRLPEDALFVLGADGRRDVGERYRSALPADARVACYAPLYGTMPAAAGFDLACAALALKEGKVFAIPRAAGCDLKGGEVALDTGRICSLRFAGAHEYASINLCRCK